MIVGSILLAFGIDAWWDRIQRSADERESLALLSRDLQDSVEQLQEFVRFSSGTSHAALQAYAALSAPGPYDHAAIHDLLLRIDRRTVRLPTAAYTDLLSTGNLRVIRDRDLRDAIIRFYEAAERSETIIDKNNTVFVDGLAWESLYRDGLVFGHYRGDMGVTFLQASHDSVRARLGSQFVHAPDPLWSLRTDSREWQQLRSRLLMIGRAHVIGELLAADVIHSASALDQTIRQRLEDR